jgi:alpha-1,6-mannosyltransferase
MRIVDVNGFYAEAGGGVRRYVDSKFEAAVRGGHELIVIAPGQASALEERDGGAVRWIPSPPMPFDPRYRRFTDRAAVWTALDAARPDVIEASSPWGSAELAGGWPGDAARSLVFHQDVVAAYAHTIGDRCIPRSWIDAAAWPWWARLRRLSRQFDVTIAGGEWLAERLLRLGVGNARAVPFGLETDNFSPAKRDLDLKAELLSRCGTGREGRLLLAVSRFHPEKRLPMVIAAFASARRQRPDLGLVVIGEGLARRGVERAVARTPGVVLLGAVADRARLAAILASADLFVHGSAAETYGLATAEAIASGLPVVTPDYGGAADLARRGWSRLYRTGDAADCGRAILQALAGQINEPSASPPGGLDDHFTALFTLYEGLVTPAR